MKLPQSLLTSFVAKYSELFKFFSCFLRTGVQSQKLRENSHDDKNWIFVSSKRSSKKKLICQHFRNSRHAVLKREDDKYFFKSFKQQQTGLGSRQPLNDISILHEIWVDFADNHFKCGYKISPPVILLTFWCWQCPSTKHDLIGTWLVYTFMTSQFLWIDLWVIHSNFLEKFLKFNTKQQTRRNITLLVKVLKTANYFNHR